MPKMMCTRDERSQCCRGSRAWEAGGSRRKKSSSCLNLLSGSEVWLLPASDAAAKSPVVTQSTDLVGAFVAGGSRTSPRARQSRGTFSGCKRMPLTACPTMESATAEFPGQIFFFLRLANSAPRLVIGNNLPESMPATGQDGSRKT